MSRTLSKFCLPFDEATPDVHFPKALKLSQNTAGLAGLMIKFHVLTTSLNKFYALTNSMIKVHILITNSMIKFHVLTTSMINFHVLTDSKLLIFMYLPL